MKAVKEFIRKYYKWVDWVQPVLTSSPQNGYQITGSNYSGDLKVLSDGVTNDAYISTTTTATYGCVITYSFPKTLKISKIGINHYSQINVTWGFSSFKIVGIMHGKEVTIAMPSLPAGSGWYTDEFTVENLLCNGIKIYCSGNGSPHPRLGEITITAQEAVETNGTDYDFYEDVPKYSLLAKSVPEYWKYTATIVDNNTITDYHGWTATSSTTFNGYSFFQGQNLGTGGTSRPLPVFTLKIPENSKSVTIKNMSLKIAGKGDGVNVYDLYKNDALIQRVTFTVQQDVVETKTLAEPIIITNADTLKVTCISYAYNSSYWTSFWTWFDMEEDVAMKVRDGDDYDFITNSFAYEAILKQ